MLNYICCWLSLHLAGLQITGNEAPSTVGTSLQLNCSSDLDFVMAEWLYNDVVIAQSTARDAVLVIPAVNDSLHNRQYKCRITYPFGVQERNTTVIVTGLIMITVLSK